MACNLDEDIKYFLKKQKASIKNNIELTNFKNHFFQENGHKINRMNPDQISIDIAEPAIN